MYVCKCKILYFNNGSCIDVGEVEVNSIGLCGHCQFYLMFCKYISYKSNCSFSFLDINTKSKKLLNYIKTSQVWTIDFNHAYNVCLDACNPRVWRPVWPGPTMYNNETLVNNASRVE